MESVGVQRGKALGNLRWTVPALSHLSIHLVELRSTEVFIVEACDQPLSGHSGKSIDLVLL